MIKFNLTSPKAKKAPSQKPKQKKQHLCHHCGITCHTRPNCYKWLATQQSNDMIASGSQNQLQSLLEIFLKPLCSFQTWTVSILSPHHKFKGLLKEKVLPRCGRKRGPSDPITSSHSSCFCFCITWVFCFSFDSV